MAGWGTRPKSPGYYDWKPEPGYMWETVEIDSDDMLHRLNGQIIPVEEAGGLWRRDSGEPQE